MLLNFYFWQPVMMLIIDHLMNSCVHCLSCLAVCGSIYTSESRLWKIDDICEEVDKITVSVLV